MRIVLTTALLMASGAYYWQHAQTPAAPPPELTAKAEPLQAPTPPPQAEPAPSSLAHDSVVKCIDSHGKIIFRKDRCDGDQQQEQVTLTSAVVDSSELRDSTYYKSKNTILSAATPNITNNNYSSGPSSARRDSLECRNAMRGYEFEDGYRYGNELSSKRAEVKRACGFWP